jgi:glyoxylase-like metal-dependent hydrolase (beta-lactamase superfamily II)
MVTLSPRVARLRAPNPGPMTLDGTNSYIIDGGDGTWLAIDPGPDVPEHVDAFVAAAAARNAQFAAILVTHGHPDHYPGAARLAAATGAPVIAHPDARFPHDRTLREGQRTTAGSASVLAIEAPGHAADHLIFVLEDERALFTGDVILGRGTTIVAPPGGDMRAYQRTLRRLRDEFGDAQAIYGGHGPEIRTPAGTIAFYIRHREEREAAILAQLDRGPATIPALVAAIYTDVARSLWPAAARQVLSYLIALEREGRITARPAGREATAEERAVLNPDLRAMRSSPDGGAVARAELGFDEAAPPLVEYALRAS